MNTIECILSRRSIRRYTVDPINESDLQLILKSAVSAPSGKNCQPWRFKVVTDKKVIQQISRFSRQNAWMRFSACFIVVFLDRSVSYNYLKDLQSCGAAMQNILLCAHALEIGSCWIGGILDASNDVKKILSVENDDLELMGLVSLGYEIKRESDPVSRPIESFLLWKRE